MEKYDAIQKTIDYIEEHLKSELTNTALARVAGYSLYHFLRIFKEVVHLTPADYIRKRRISEIVRRINSEKAPISAIAFEYGFNSKENFVRAFKREHHILPKDFRLTHNSLKLYGRLDIVQPDMRLNPAIVHLEAFRIVAYPSTEEFPPHFWNRYNANGWSQKLSGGKTVADYGISLWDSQRQKLNYLIGIHEREACGDTTGTSIVDIPAGTYAVFETPAADSFDFVNTIHRTWSYIADVWLKENGYCRTGGPEFEAYVEESRTYQEKIYIPIVREEQSMKKLNVSFDGITDTTGYLFSLAKCIAASLRCSPFADKAQDIIAASGFAFRMWVDPQQLCPSAASIWAFKQQRSWVENGGLVCQYIERLWNEEAREESVRIAAIEMIKESIDNGIAPVAWDISGCEWGLIIGYDEANARLLTLKVNGCEDSIPYERLGKLEIPILSVLAVMGKTEKTDDQIMTDTMQLAASHLRGEEWCENASGLAAYDAIISFVRDRWSEDAAWNLEYNLGTYAALKWYAWKYFENHGKQELAELYQTIHASWQTAFQLLQSKGSTDETVRNKITALLETAKAAETLAAEQMR